MRKMMIAIAAMMITASFAFAQETAPSADPGMAKKITKVEAKKMCKHESKKMKGKALKKCIKEKMAQ